VNQAEEDQARLVVELKPPSRCQAGALLPFCSACKLDMVIPADPARSTVAAGVVRI
jgi:hypothetical protein